MAQLIGIGLVGALVWYAWTALKRQMNTVGEKVRDTEHARAEKARSEKVIESLEPGEDGVYRPRASAADKREEGDGR